MELGRPRRLHHDSVKIGAWRWSSGVGCRCCWALREPYFMIGEARLSRAGLEDEAKYVVRLAQRHVDTGHRAAVRRKKRRQCWKDRALDRKSVV